MSEASPNEPELQDDGIRPSAFKVGANEAHRLSISAYETLLKSDPSNQKLREHLAKIAAGQDTHQRKWYCFAD